MEPVNPYLEFIFLHADLTAQEVDAALGHARQFKLAAICLPPFWIKKASRDLKETSTQLVTAIGYPYGYQMTEAKIQQIDQAIENGTDEIEISLNLSAFKSGMPWVKIELAKCAQLIHEQGKIMSVLLDCNFLSRQELHHLTPICRDAGSDFLTFARPSLDPEFITFLKSIVPGNLGIKFQCESPSLADCTRLIEAGADRIGIIDHRKLVQTIAV